METFLDQLSLQKRNDYAVDLQKAQFSFAEGVEAIELIAKKVRNSNQKSLSRFNESEDAQTIRKLANKATTQLSESAAVCGKFKDEVDSHIRKCVSEMGVQEREKRQKESQRDQKLAELCQLQDNVHNAKAAVDRAENSLTDAEKTLNQKKKEVEEERQKGFVRIIGGGLLGAAAGALAGPVGAVAGAAAGSVGGLLAAIKILEEARDAAKRARNDLEEAKKQLSRANDKCHEVKNELGDCEKAIQTCEFRVRELSSELEALRTSQKSVAEFGTKVKQVLNILTEMHGKSKVVRMTAKYLYSLEPLEGPLKDCKRLLDTIMGREEDYDWLTCRLTLRSSREGKFDMGEFFAHAVIVIIAMVVAFLLLSTYFG